MADPRKRSLGWASQAQLVAELTRRGWSAELVQEDDTLYLQLNEPHAEARKRQPGRWAVWRRRSVR